MTATISVPDTALAREATELVRDTTGPSCTTTPRGSTCSAPCRAARRGLGLDAELLYVAAMFHDIGLGQAHHPSGRRFELDGAVAARGFLRGHDVAEEQRPSRVDGHRPAHHPGHPGVHGAGDRAAHGGRRVRRAGHRLPRHRPEQRAEVVALHPRPDFKRRILQSFTDGIAPKPDTTFGNVKADVLAHYVPGFRRGDFVETILNSPWED